MSTLEHEAASVAVSLEVKTVISESLEARLGLANTGSISELVKSLLLL